MLHPSPFQINHLVSLVRDQYPRWDGFSHADFVADEIDYKRRASEQAVEVLARGNLQSLIEQEKYDEFVISIENVARSTNLLFMSVPQSGDLSILYAEGKRPEVCKAIFELLHSFGTPSERFGRFTSRLTELGIRTKWPLPTYLLFLLDPVNNIIVSSHPENASTGASSKFI